MGRSFVRHPAPWVFVILLSTYAYFWQTRDWNTASRLTLTYAMVDRAALSIDGLERQTGDRAYVNRHFYSDKLPGFSLLAVIPYAALEWLVGWPAHPLHREAIRYWAADYWVTLATSGVLSAGTGVVLVLYALKLGCTRRRAALVGLAYGLSTPAFVYATLAYGHQASAFALFAAFALLSSHGRYEWARLFTAGFLTAYASLIELSVGPVSAILGGLLIWQCARGERKSAAVGQFVSGAALPTLILLAYNFVAFGSPFDMGYFHHATEQFARVHSKENPLGLRAPDWSKLGPLLWGQDRGITFYAPIFWLSVPGWIVLVLGKQIRAASVSLLVVISVFLVNLSYPEWKGGWCTGPRLLVPMFPFAMVPVAAVLSGSGWCSRGMTAIAVLLAIGGAILMLLFEGASGRIPVDLERPLEQLVWPIWTGAGPLPAWYEGMRFCRNAASELAPGWVGSLAPRWQCLQFAPLLVFQVVAIALAWAVIGGGEHADESSTPPAARDEV